MNAPFRKLRDPVPFRGVDFLHPDPLADDSLFVEPEITRRTFDRRGFPKTWKAGTGAPNFLDICRLIVGSADLGMVHPPGDEDSGYVVLRRRDWESVERERAAP